MRRRRWARLAAACLVALAVLLAAVHGGVASGTGAPMPAPRRSGAARVAAAFDAAVANRVARCKKQGNRAAGAACAGLPSGGGGDDDKRVVPTGSNPLHNR